jgi:regulatory protein
LQGLQEDGLQDDGRFIEIFVRSQFGKSRGPQRIRQELRQKGIASAESEPVLNEYDWDTALERVYAKKYGETALANPKDYAARMRFLSQRGFETDRIQAFLRRLSRGDE